MVAPLPCKNKNDSTKNEGVKHGVDIRLFTNSTLCNENNEVEIAYLSATKMNLRVDFGIQS